MGLIFLGAPSVNLLEHCNSLIEYLTQEEGAQLLEPESVTQDILAILRHQEEYKL